jgi:glycosyltransferase involved in cell wall biosynthesis
MKKVVIIQRIIAPYRIPFYDLLRKLLWERDIELAVVYGQPAPSEQEPYADLPSGIKLRAKYIHIGKRFFVWLPAFRLIRDSDLVIVQQANKNLLNYLLIPLRKILGFKLAFWGHGRNLQAGNRNSVSERWKRFYSLRADHWFAYTDLSKEILREQGFPEERITSVNNSIDTSESIRMYGEITEEEINELRQQYSITRNTPVGIFCSRLYEAKRIEFLLECITRVKERVPDFHFFVIGSGPKSSLVEDYARDHDGWFHYVGPKYGMDKVKFFRLARFQLMPGLVGLHIVDSFALLTPLITTKIDFHSPEIVYRENGVNGIMTDNSPEAYVAEIVRLIEDNTYQQRLITGCMKAREQYTIENMASRFAAGIVLALGERRWKTSNRSAVGGKQ